MNFFNNNPASIFKSVKSFVTYSQGDNRLNVSVKQLNELVANVNCINKNTLREVNDTFTITSLVPGPIIVNRMNGGTGGTVNPGLSATCIDCTEDEKKNAANTTCTCGGKFETGLQTGKKREECSAGVARTAAGTYTVTLTWLNNTPYYGTILRVGNPSEMSHIISVQKVSNTEYTIKVFDSISGSLVDFGLDQVPLIVTTFYVDQNA